MKIVQNIKWERPEVSGRVSVEVHPYAGLCAEKPHYSGARAEVTIFSSMDDDSQDEVILEGSLEDVRAALREAVEMLDCMESHYKEEYEAHAANSVKCDVCGTWFDQRDPVIGHPDGRGNTCLQDGTVLTSIHRPILLWSIDSENPWVEHEGPLHKGDRFKFGSAPWQEEGVEHIALEDSRSHFMNGNPPSAVQKVRIKRSE